MKVLTLMALACMLFISGCCCCCGPSCGGSGGDGDWSFINLTSPKGNECVSDLSCNGNEECHNGYCV